MAAVVPLVGTWIEITQLYRNYKMEVVPLVGTWIEIIINIRCNKIVGRAPRGHVD